MLNGIDLVLTFFEELNAIPRCSGDEARVAQWLAKWADARGFSHRSDPTGNMVVRVPASPGCENAPVVVIQGHTDMVCEKTPESPHDFSKDPIKHIREGDWLKADGTTLGADNGIAVAYAMALADDAAVMHPPLELLFTVNEESGLGGVKTLDPSLVAGRILINLDSEDEGVFTIGCAGGHDIAMALDMQTEPLDPAETVFEVTVGGLIGGHSGIDIHKQRGNANKIMTYFLSTVQKELDFRLIGFKGGSRHNAIPRDAKAWIGCAAGKGDVLSGIAQRTAGQLRQTFRNSDQQLRLTVSENKPDGAAGLSGDQTRHVLALLSAIPNGVFAMSGTMKGVVDTSCNLATVALSDGRLNILTSQRGSDPVLLQQLLEGIRGLARLAGAAITSSSGYPPWIPDFGSQLLKRSEETFTRLYGKAPVVQSIHAGLECAIIGGLIDGMEMISFGPDIRNPHSPDERINLPSVERVWGFVTALLETFCRQA